MSAALPVLARMPPSLITHAPGAVSHPVSVLPSNRRVQPVQPYGGLPSGTIAPPPPDAPASPVTPPVAGAPAAPASGSSGAPAVPPLAPPAPGSITAPPWLAPGLPPSAPAGPLLPPLPTAGPLPPSPSSPAPPSAVTSFSRGADEQPTSSVPTIRILIAVRMVPAIP